MMLQQSLWEPWWLLMAGRILCLDTLTKNDSHPRQDRVSCRVISPCYSEQHETYSLSIAPSGTFHLIFWGSDGPSMIEMSELYRKSRTSIISHQDMATKFEPLTFPLKATTKGEEKENISTMTPLNGSSTRLGICAVTMLPLTLSRDAKEDITVVLLRPTVK